MADDKLQPVTESPTDMAGIVDNANLTERPAFIAKGDKTGTEGITQEDIRLPRIVIAQGLSPEVLPGPEKIKGLEVPQMFNDFTRKNYGTGPLYFIPIRHDRRCIQFKPRADGGGVVDLNVPWNDDRATKWVGNNPPVATRFHEWVVLILLNPTGDTEPGIVSIKMTNKHNRRAAERELNGFIKMYASRGDKSVPIYGVIYKMTSRAVPNTKGTGGMYGVPSFEAAGFVPNTPVGQMLFERASEYAVSIRGKATVTPRQPGDEEFVDGEEVGGGDTPF